MSPSKHGGMIASSTAALAMVTAQTRQVDAITNHMAALDISALASLTMLSSVDGVVGEEEATKEAITMADVLKALTGVSKDGPEAETIANLMKASDSSVGELYIYLKNI